MSTDSSAFAAAIRITRKSAAASITALALACAAAPPLYAQSYPAKSVRIIVPFAAGGGTAIQGHLLGKKLYESLGQTFVIDNRPGEVDFNFATALTAAPHANVNRKGNIAIQ